MCEAVEYHGCGNAVEVLLAADRENPSQVRDIR
jgi:hypothetical protein